MITLAIIAKHGTNTFQTLVDTALNYVGEVVVAVDDGAGPGIEGYKAPPVRYFSRALAKNFSAQRNFLINAATGDWVLHLDTDETLTTWLWERLEVVCALTTTDLLLLPRENRYVEEPDKLVGWPDWQPKLHRRNGIHFQLPVHEWPCNYKTVQSLPADARYAIQHTKSWAAQQVANELYQSICSN